MARTKLVRQDRGLRSALLGLRAAGGINVRAGVFGAPAEYAPRVDENTAWLSAASERVDMVALREQASQLVSRGVPVSEALRIVADQLAEAQRAEIIDQDLIKSGAMLDAVKGEVGK